MTKESDNDVTVGRKYGITDHAFRQAHKRLNKSLAIRELADTCRRSVFLFTAPDGEQYRWADFGDTHGIVFVVDKRRRNVSTVVTAEMAFSDCPKAVFLALMQAGYIGHALSLRAKGKLRELPRALEKQYHYPRRKADVAWNIFRWMNA